MSTASGLKNLFFVKRRPKWKLMFAPDWESPLPGNPTEWDKELASHGFMPSSTTTDVHKTVPPSIAADLKELDKSELLTTFFKLSHRAKYFQNWFYVSQWIFVFGAFLTTLFGGCTVLTSTQAAIQAAAPQNTNSATSISFINPTGQSNDPTANSLAKLSGVITTILATLTGFTNAIYNHFKPQQNWFACRRQTENLRAQYFLFLAHIGIYKDADRNMALRKVVIEAGKVLQ